MIIIAAVIITFGAGHLVRDGWPALGSTHLARLFGGLWCVAGAALLSPGWDGVILGAAVYVGFYADMEHGEGHRTRGWIDVQPLLVSGLTSILPLSVAVATRSWDIERLELVVDLPTLAFALAKPAIWFACWRLPAEWWSDDPQGLWKPTRAAAVTWGAIVGLAVVIVSE